MQDKMNHAQTYSKEDVKWLSANFSIEQISEHIVANESRFYHCQKKQL